MPRARKSDPYTSHLAAEEVMNYTQVQIFILELFNNAVDGFTDEELVGAYNRTFGIQCPASDASLRSRRAELRDRNQLRDSGHTRMTRLGHKSIVWVTYERLI